MRKRITWVLLFLLSALSMQAQHSYVRTIGAGIGSESSSCIPTIDNGSVMSVTISTVVLGTRMSLVKTDAKGDLQWNSIFQVDSFTMPKTVVQTPDNGYMIYGSCFGPQGFNDAALFLLNTDSAGNKRWTKTYRLSANELPVRLFACKGGGYTMCSVVGYNTGWYPYVGLTRVDALGNVLWSKSWRTPYFLESVCCTQLPDGSYAFACKTNGYGNGAPAPYEDMVVARIDSSGKQLWAKVIASKNGITPYAMQSNAAGDIFIAGNLYTNAMTNGDGFLCRLNAKGKLITMRTYDASTVGGEVLRALALRKDGSCVLAGDIGAFDERTPVALQTNATGDMVWSNMYPFSPDFTNYIFDMYEARDGGLVMTGDVNPPTDYRKAALFKTDRQGNLPCFSTAIKLQSAAVNYPVIDTMLEEAVISNVSSTPTWPLVYFGIVFNGFYCGSEFPVSDFTYSMDSSCNKICGRFTGICPFAASSWSWQVSGATQKNYSGPNPQICFAQAGTYNVRLIVTHSLGTDTITKQVVIYQQPHCPGAVIIPNVFTPNGDGVNEVFEIIGLPEIFLLHVYNRWGQQVFFSNTPDTFWNGTHAGKEAVEGVYYYELALPGGVNKSGVVHLLR